MRGSSGAPSAQRRRLPRRDLELLEPGRVAVPDPLPGPAVQVGGRFDRHDHAERACSPLTRSNSGSFHRSSGRRGAFGSTQPPGRNSERPARVRLASTTRSVAASSARAALSRAGFQPVHRAVVAVGRVGHGQQHQIERGGVLAEAVLLRHLGRPDRAPTGSGPAATRCRPRPAPPRPGRPGRRAAPRTAGRGRAAAPPRPRRAAGRRPRSAGRYGSWPAASSSADRMPGAGWSSWVAMMTAPYRSKPSPVSVGAPAAFRNAGRSTYCPRSSTSPGLASRSRTAASAAGSAARIGSPAGSRWASQAARATEPTSVSAVNPAVSSPTGLTRSPLTAQARSRLSSRRGGRVEQRGQRLAGVPAGVLDRADRLAEQLLGDGRPPARPRRSTPRPRRPRPGPSVHSRAGSAGSSAADHRPPDAGVDARAARPWRRRLGRPSPRAWCASPWSGSSRSCASTCGRPATTSRAIVSVTPVSRANSSAASGSQGAGPRAASSVRNAAEPARLAAPRRPGPRTATV